MWLYKAKRELADEELAVYKREQKVKIDEEIAEYKKSTIDLAVSCANDTKEYEHTYHSKMETLGIDIAKLEAKKEHLEEEMKLIKENDAVCYEKIITSKDAEIERLTETLNKLIEKQPQTIIQQKVKS